MGAGVCDVIVDHVPFVIEVDCFQRLPGEALVDVEQIMMVAVEVGRAFTSIVTTVPGQDVAA